MIKKIFFILCISILPAQAFQDCVITSDSKLSDIKVEKAEIVEVSPIYTLMNEKNTLYVQPLKVGKTKICVLKDNKDIVKFDIEITEEETKIDAVEGFEVLTVDMPFDNQDEFELDIPPLGGET